MTKQIFHAQLSRIKLNHKDWRPFLCHGHPMDADVFIIGENPTTPGLPDWWNFWDREAGFDYNAMERCNQVLRGGKSSPTRKRVRALCDGLGSGIRWVETNLYPIASTKAKFMPSIGKNNQHLDLLLSSCQPKVLYVHGTKCTPYFITNFGIELGSVSGGRYVGPIRCPGRDTLIYHSYQLSLGPGHDVLRALGQQIQRECRALTEERGAG